MTHRKTENKIKRAKETRGSTDDGGANWKESRTSHLTRKIVWRVVKLSVAKGKDWATNKCKICGHRVHRSARTWATVRNEVQFRALIERTMVGKGERSRMISNLNVSLWRKEERNGERDGRQSSFSNWNRMRSGKWGQQMIILIRHNVYAASRPSGTIHSNLRCLEWDEGAREWSRE